MNMFSRLSLVIFLTSLNAYAQNVSPLKCGEIRSVANAESCPEMVDFTKSAFATCMDYNLAAKMWSKDQAARTQGDSQFFAEFMNAKKALRNQLIGTMNQLATLSKKSDCFRFIQKGDLNKSLLAMKSAAAFTEVVFPDFDFEKMKRRDCDNK